jgi:hypothetical protein
VVVVVEEEGWYEQNWEKNTVIFDRNCSLWGDDSKLG